MGLTLWAVQPAPAHRLLFLPQVIKTWKKGRRKIFPLMMFLIASLNEIMWVIYGILVNNWIIILTNAVILVMSLTMIYFKLKYK